MTRNENEVALLIERIFIDVQAINEDATEIWVNEYHFATIGRNVWNVLYFKPWELEFERGADFPEEAATRLRDCILNKRELCDGLREFVKMKREQQNSIIEKDTLNFL